MKLVFKFWDNIFAEYYVTGTMEFIDLIALSMLKFCRGRLIREKDYGIALQKLVNYSKPPEPLEVIKSAYQYKRKQMKIEMI